MKAYFFIDPGQSGGIAIALGSMDDLAAHNLDGVSSLQELLQDYECYERRIICENVPSYTGRNIPSHASFKLGRSFGLIEGLARGMGLPCALIGPKVWQKGLDGLKGKSGMARKRILKDHAQRLYPATKPTLRTADAILIGHYFLTNHQHKEI